MIKVGEFNRLKVIKEKTPGVFLDDGADGILLPKRYVPAGSKVGDELEVFIYHDSEDRLIATTEKPYGILGDIVRLKAVGTSAHGAFLDWGLMKDLFVPRSKQVSFMQPTGEYFVKIMIDESTGRLYGTEKFESSLVNENLSVKELDEVDLLVYRKTNLGYVVIINNRYTGVLHFNEVYRPIGIGDRFPGFVKKITPGKSGEPAKIDVVLGKSGYQRVEDEAGKILRLLKEHGGSLPYGDHSLPEDIYAFFGMSKKTFKMSIGRLFRDRKIVFTREGISLAS
ncbi:MAG: RNA-binding protein [Bacteroidota bacterium]|nr:RNA-binding protein [Bacteroidota bacterium]